jgi:uncharacterized protein YjiS (DUF1127 family)
MLRSLHPTSGEATGTLTPSFTHPRAARQLERPRSFVEGLVARLLGADAPAFVQLPLLWMRRSRYRQELANLSETQLRDVGLNPNLVYRESAKPFWMA